VRREKETTTRPRLYRRHLKARKKKRGPSLLPASSHPKRPNPRWPTAWTLPNNSVGILDPGDGLQTLKRKRKKGRKSTGRRIITKAGGASGRGEEERKKGGGDASPLSPMRRFPMRKEKEGEGVVLVSLISSPPASQRKRKEALHPPRPYPRKGETVDLLPALSGVGLKGRRKKGEGKKREEGGPPKTGGKPVSTPSPRPTRTRKEGTRGKKKGGIRAQAWRQGFPHAVGEGGKKGRAGQAQSVLSRQRGKKKRGRKSRSPTLPTAATPAIKEGKGWGISDLAYYFLLRREEKERKRGRVVIYPRLERA